MFLRQSILHGGLPFELKIPKYNKTTLDALTKMEESKGKNISGKNITALISSFEKFGKVIATNSKARELWADQTKVALIATYIASKLALSLEGNYKIIFEDWLLNRRFMFMWQALGLTYSEEAAMAIYALSSIKELNNNIFKDMLITDTVLAKACGVNKFDGIVWFNSEKTTVFINNYFYYIMIFDSYINNNIMPIEEIMANINGMLFTLNNAIKNSEYKVNIFLKILKSCLQ
jgi:hypothetical protein